MLFCLFVCLFLCRWASVPMSRFWMRSSIHPAVEPAAAFTQSRRPAGTGQKQAVPVRHLRQGIRNRVIASHPHRKGTVHTQFANFSYSYFLNSFANGIEVELFQLICAFSIVQEFKMKSTNERTNEQTNETREKKRRHWFFFVSVPALLYSTLRRVDSQLFFFSFLSFFLSFSLCVCVCVVEWEREIGKKLCVCLSLSLWAL